MSQYKTPVKDLEFVFNQVLDFTSQRETLGFESCDEDVVHAVFEEAGKLAENVLAPLNNSGDVQGCKLEDGVVTPPDGFGEAYKQYVEGCWGGISDPEEYGGQEMPHALGFMLHEVFGGANHAFFMYPSLTHGAFAAISNWGTEEQKATYLPKMCNCAWSGTMNLTEPHCGTDLGLLRSKAEPQADGSYSITGTKIFISAGEHDMAENIIHLVLARLPDAPAGTKGITLFIVPKFLVNEDGSLGERNAVTCASIEHKMGIHGNATCVLNYDGAKGFLIGKPNKGLRAMFTMMNSARLGVALSGLAASEISYQRAKEYALERLQGRALTGPENADGEADPIIVHPDVRRMLLTVRSFAEGSRALGAWLALQLDISHKHPDETEREKAEDFLGLLTPVVKAFYTDEGFTSANHAIQVYGGHGYITEHGVEQLARDARISMIYEGANGIQAMDLVGRKLFAKGGKAVQAWNAFVQEELAAARAVDHADVKTIADGLARCDESLQTATAWFMENALENPNNAGSGASDFLRLFGIVAVGVFWTRMARISATALANGTADPDFHQTKLVVGKVFMERFGTEHSALLARVQSGSDSLMALQAEAF